jgi:peptidoglycan hydrolase-like protein with peptidoglycan-binding domain
MTNGTDTTTLIRPRHAGTVFNRATGGKHTFVLKRFRAHVLDVQDLHFHFDSAVLMPDFNAGSQGLDGVDDDGVTGLDVVRTVYRHLERHPEQKILIAGHADRRGSAAYNVELSQLRADNVLHVLQGNRDAWVGICVKKSRVEDYQQILKWLATSWGWACDPGKIDNILGPKTRAAVRAFQETYNRGAPSLPDGFKANITVDGIVGRQTWGAFFDVYMRALQLALEVDAPKLRAIQQGLRFVDPARKTVGCGEHFPRSANPALNGQSSTGNGARSTAGDAADRRVEILFFDPGEEPRLDCHAGSGRCVPAACEIYNRRHYFLQPLFTEACIRVKPTGRSAERYIWIEVHHTMGLYVREPFELVVHGRSTKGQTTEKGVIEATVPADATEGWLTIGEHRYKLALVDDEIGDGLGAAQTRLNNLGYDCGPTDGIWGERSRAAMRLFQAKCNLAPTGNADAESLARLKREHDFKDSTSAELPPNIADMEASDSAYANAGLNA